MDYSAIKPFIDIFSRAQIQTMLIAWPISFNEFLAKFYPSLIKIDSEKLTKIDHVI
jgi:hypothetical protein